MAETKKNPGPKEFWDKVNDMAGEDVMDIVMTCLRTENAGAALDSIVKRCNIVAELKQKQIDALLNQRDMLRDACKEIDKREQAYEQKGSLNYNPDIHRLAEAAIAACREESNG